MTKSATDLMQEIIFSAVIDSIGALKAASKGVPNTLLRDLNAVHANTTLPDLPPELQAAIAANVRSAFTRLLREGYSVAPAGASAPRVASPPRDLADRAQQQRRRPPPPKPGSTDPRKPRGGGRPNRPPPKPRGS
ncbi:hypothetical protein GCM10009087_10950 [Sphingomonas oligophenolica]|uniref:Uncharacterized protein n=1 Tax=Sphingomonas oligophenolica TaxID=301154 RepID=A0ABU9Y9Q6_9SPHN